MLAWLLGQFWIWQLTVPVYPLRTQYPLFSMAVYLQWSSPHLLLLLISSVRLLNESLGFFLSTLLPWQNISLIFLLLNCSFSGKGRDNDCLHSCYNQCQPSKWHLSFHSVHCSKEIPFICIMEICNMSLAYIWRRKLFNQQKKATGLLLNKLISCSLCKHSFFGTVPERDCK